MRSHLRETATNRVKINSLARKYEHLRINQIQLRFLHFNQHSITLLGIHMGHSAYKREKCTFIIANIQVINTILKVNGDSRQTLKCKQYSITFLWHHLQFNIAFLDGLRMVKTNNNAVVQSIGRSLHLICKNRFLIKQYKFQTKIGQSFYATWFKEPRPTAPLCVLWIAGIRPKP